MSSGALSNKNETNPIRRRTLIYGAFLLVTAPLLVMFGRRVYDKEVARQRTEEGYRSFMKFFNPRPEAPVFALKNLDATEESLQGYAGKVVFLNFRTTW